MESYENVLTTPLNSFPNCEFAIKSIKLIKLNKIVNYIVKTYK